MSQKNVKRINVFFTLILMMTFCFFTPDQALSQSKGRITGRITDAGTGDFLPGANVMIQGTSFGSATDRQGNYRIESVPAGSYTLLVSYIGYEDFTTEVTVTAGTKTKQDAALKVSYVEMEEVVVQGLRQGQAKALSQQRSSNHIMNVVSSEAIEQFPDPNAAEALQRIPGISISVYFFVSDGQNILQGKIHPEDSTILRNILGNG